MGEYLNIPGGNIQINPLTNFPGFIQVVLKQKVILWTPSIIGNDERWKNLMYLNMSVTLPVNQQGSMKLLSEKKGVDFMHELVMLHSQIYSHEQKIPFSMPIAEMNWEMPDWFTVTSKVINHSLAERYYGKTLSIRPSSAWDFGGASIHLVTAVFEGIARFYLCDFNPILFSGESFPHSLIHQPGVGVLALKETSRNWVGLHSSHSVNIVKLNKVY